MKTSVAFLLVLCAQLYTKSEQRIISDAGSQRRFEMEMLDENPDALSIDSLLEKLVDENTDSDLVNTLGLLLGDHKIKKLLKEKGYELIDGFSTRQSIGGMSGRCSNNIKKVCRLTRCRRYRGKRYCIRKCHKMRVETCM